MQNFRCNIKFLKYVLETELPKKIACEKNVGAIPYIVLKTLTYINVNLPSLEVQNKIVDITEKIELNLSNEGKILENYKKEKSYLLANRFV